jgi:hypothetical protein
MEEYRRNLWAGQSLWREGSCMDSVGVDGRQGYTAAPVIAVVPAIVPAVAPAIVPAVVPAVVPAGAAGAVDVSEAVGAAEAAVVTSVVTSSMFADSMVESVEVIKVMNSSEHGDALADEDRMVSPTGVDEVAMSSFAAPKEITKARRRVKDIGPIGTVSAAYAQSTKH